MTRLFNILNISNVEDPQDKSPVIMNKFSNNTNE